MIVQKKIIEAIRYYETEEGKSRVTFDDIADYTDYECVDLYLMLKHMVEKGRIGYIKYTCGTRDYYYTKDNR